VYEALRIATRMAEITSDDLEFRMHVTATLATLVAEQKGTREQVTRQNGNVASIFQRLAVVESRVASGEAAQEAGDATAARISGRWEGWVRPVIGALAGALVALLVQKLMGH
jgi:hypothetical protein